MKFFHIPTTYETDPARSRPYVEEGIEQGAKFGRNAPETYRQWHKATQGMTWPEAAGYIDTQCTEGEKVLSAAETIAATEEGSLKLFVLRDSLNGVEPLNSLLYASNRLLAPGGWAVWTATTSGVHRRQMMDRLPWGIREIAVLGDYIWSRMLPKFSLTRPLWKLCGGARHRNLPRVEILGRICRAGFSIVDERQIGDLFRITAVKLTEPLDREKPHYGMVIKLKRISRDGKLISVYKLRSMYAYSEYLQDYTYKCLGLQQGGKFKNDPRITHYGRFIRKCWIDELPMIANLLKGDLKLVGVRPLSRHYFSLYTPEMQKLRIQVKPGLIPPFYAEPHPPVTIEQVQESERKYILASLERPFWTDVRYLGMALYNIIFRRERSN